jgi:hypothetical protein
VRTTGDVHVLFYVGFNVKKMYGLGKRLRHEKNILAYRKYTFRKSHSILIGSLIDDDFPKIQGLLFKLLP